MNEGTYTIVIYKLKLGTSTPTPIHRFPPPPYLQPMPELVSLGGDVQGLGPSL
jgi:hypothetical protein